MENIKQKWKCNKCNYETEKKPKINSTCQECKKGRYQFWALCKCGQWFHPETIKQKYCSKECGYKFKNNGGKKGKHYPNTQRARIAECIVCHKEFRAVKDYKNVKQKYCSKYCWSHRGKRTKRIQRTPEEKRWKAEVLKRDNYTCQKCGAKKRLEAHHIKEKVNYPELKNEIDNGICLCHDCHRKTDNYGYRAKNKHRWEQMTGETAVKIE